MVSDIWEYFDRRRRECRDLSLSEDELAYFEEEGMGGRWGHIQGAVTLTDEAYLAVHEVINLDAGDDPRVEYSYYLVHEGAEVWGRERDPSHDPAVHAHGRDHVRFDDEQHQEPVSFKLVVEMAWDTISKELT